MVLTKVHMWINNPKIHYLIPTEPQGTALTKSVRSPAFLNTHLCNSNKVFCGIVFYAKIAEPD